MKNGEALFERDSVLFDRIKYSWPITACLMRGAAINCGNLSVCDYGGSLGSLYYQNQKFIKGLKSLRWSIIEQPHFVKAGKAYIENFDLKFFYDIDSLIEQETPNVFVFSSSAQYLPNLDQVLNKISKLSASIIVFDRTPFHDGMNDIICTQKVHPKAYLGSYPMKIISINSLQQRLVGWDQVEVFGCPEGNVLSDAGIKIRFEGRIFEKKHV